MKLTTGEQNFLTKYFPKEEIGTVKKYTVTTMFGDTMLLDSLGYKLYMWIIGIEGILNNPKMFTEKTMNTYKVKSKGGLIQIFDRGRYLFMKLYPEYAEMVH